MYRHFKCTPLSSACFHLMWGLEPKEEETNSITSTLCPHGDEDEEEENSSPRSLCRALLAVLPRQPPPLSLLRSLLAVAVCACRKNLKAPPDQLFIQNLVFFSQGCLLTEQSWLQVLAPAASQATCVWVPLQAEVNKYHLQDHQSPG